MKNAFVLLLSVLALSCGSKKNTAENYTVDQKSVESTIKFLSDDALEGRLAGSKGLETAAQYLADNFKKNGVQPYFSTYFDTLSNYKETTYNVIGYLEGNDPELKNEFVVFGAHYDHIGISDEPVDGDKIFNGANDDASGCTAVTELVNYFAKTKSNKRSILFCYFSAEEAGLLGSRHLAPKLKEQGFNMYAMLNFEMVGVPMKNETMQAYVTGWGMSNMGEKINQYAGKTFVGNLPEEIKYQLFRRSDNYSFYQEFNVPSQTICTFDFTNFDYYHHVKDEFANMDVVHMTSFIQQVLPVAAGMANSATKEIVLKK
jgi:Zn-dependent M28 family amino/carboxypeptidase